jgi:hypothetical protein
VIDPDPREVGLASQTIPYVVRGGDYLTAIAHSRGLKPDDIWQHPANASLRKNRPNPEILAPGDLLFIPVVECKWLSVSPGTSNQYVVTVPLVEVHVVLHGPNGKPLTGQRVDLVPDLGAQSPMTDGDGLLKVKVPVTLRRLTVKIHDSKLKFEIRIGALDPHDTSSGTLSRLRQLGYVGSEGHLASSGRPYLAGADLSENALRRAVSAYQSNNGHEVTGTVDTALGEQIRTGYGA